VSLQEGEKEGKFKIDFSTTEKLFRRIFSRFAPFDIFQQSVVVAWREEHFQQISSTLHVKNLLKHFSSLNSRHFLAKIKLYIFVSSRIFPAVLVSRIARVQCAVARETFWRGKVVSALYPVEMFLWDSLLRKLT
jgi:hypothetical protein